MAIYLVRHAHAGQRGVGFHDQFRQLSDRGRERSAELVDVFAELTVSSIWSSPMTRCVQTVQPVSEAQGVEITEDEAFNEPAPAVEAIERLGQIDVGGDVVVCSHGNLIPEIISWLVERDGLSAHGRGCEKGSIWRLRRDGPRWSQATYLGLARSPQDLN